jgi:hypothetical protein
VAFSSVRLSEILAAEFSAVNANDTSVDRSPKSQTIGSPGPGASKQVSASAEQSSARKRNAMPSEVQVKG